MDDPIWDVTVFTKNRQRLPAGDIAEAFFAAVLQQAHQRNLLSDEHFTAQTALSPRFSALQHRKLDSNARRKYRKASYTPYRTPFSAAC